MLGSQLLQSTHGKGPDAGRVAKVHHHAFTAAWPGLPLQLCSCLLTPAADGYTWSALSMTRGIEGLRQFKTLVVRQGPKILQVAKCLHLCMFRHAMMT